MMTGLQIIQTLNLTFKTMAKKQSGVRAGLKNRFEKDKNGKLIIPKGTIINFDCTFELQFGFNSPKEVPSQKVYMGDVCRIAPTINGRGSNNY